MIKVLIAEDDPMVAQINRKCIKAVEGFQVVGTASNGEEALKLIKSTKPNLLVLDIYMPKLNGLQLLKNIRKEDLAVDVILVTAAKDLSSIEEGFKWGVVDYLVKPFELARFRTALEDYKNRKLQLSKKERIAQEDIDQIILGKKIKSTHLDLDKGMHQKTMEKIKTCLLQDVEAKSALEVAEALGLARVTVRRYLEHLVEIGEAEVEIQYGTVGRPQHRYFLKRPI
ncbi:two-component system, CitB family, response regulator DctR [Anaerovirgula multivorans]|uniref:Transcriptional regulatory protein n=1 Tax=Anaerovirgula multivorans TaxID=312168 RepID=A0A239BW34_9FIRM|nr:response regulator [Anaerovirgula multivorans]SNS11373.1 two-component system, CitB family, response regulator DctR [Anaerovirgula multivorans]